MEVRRQRSGEIHVGDHSAADLQSLLGDETGQAGQGRPDMSCDQLARLRLDADMRAGLELHRRGALEGVKQKTAEGAGARISALTRRWGSEGRVRLCDALALADRTRTRGIRTLVSLQLRLQMLTSTGSHG
jgi:hypothetical protein